MIGMKKMKIISNVFHIVIILFGLFFMAICIKFPAVSTSIYGERFAELTWKYQYSKTIKADALFIKYKCERYEKYHYFSEDDCRIYEVMKRNRELAYKYPKNITKSDMIIRSYLSIKQDPDTVSKEGGICQGVAFYTANLLKNLGYENIYLVIQTEFLRDPYFSNGHVCVWLKDYNIYFNCFDDLTIMEMRRVY